MMLQFDTRINLHIQTCTSTHTCTLGGRRWSGGAVGRHRGGMGDQSYDQAGGGRGEIGPWAYQLGSCDHQLESCDQGEAGGASEGGWEDPRDSTRYCVTTAVVRQ